MADHILVAYDESPQAHAALLDALSVHPEAAVTVLHVTDPREWVYVDDVGGGYYSEAVRQRAETTAEELLEEAIAAARSDGREVETAVTTGRPTEAIVDYAETHDVDRIVLGSHGRTGLSRFLLGSVAEGVVRRAPVSVTVVRERDDDPAA